MESNADEKEKASNSEAATWVLAALGVIVLYVASIGPVSAMCKSGKVPRKWDKAVEAFYLPVIWLYENTPCKSPLERYCKWWERFL